MTREEARLMGVAGEAVKVGEMTANELEALRLSGRLADALAPIVADGPTFDQDLRELVTHMHAIQHAILCNVAARANPLVARELGASGVRRAE